MYLCFSVQLHARVFRARVLRAQVEKRGNSQRFLRSFFFSSGFLSEVLASVLIPIAVFPEGYSLSLFGLGATPSYASGLTPPVSSQGYHFR